jgi:hypothetical protein
MNTVLRVVTVVFWIAAPVCVASMVASSISGSAAAWLTWTIGISLSLTMLSSGVIAWVEFGKNPLLDAERGEWTNKMLFYALAFTVTLFVGFLYLPTLFFAR